MRTMLVIALCCAGLQAGEAPPQPEEERAEKPPTMTSEEYDAGEAQPKPERKVIIHRPEAKEERAPAREPTPSERILLQLFELGEPERAEELERTQVKLKVAKERKQKDLIRSLEAQVKNLKDAKGVYLPSIWLKEDSIGVYRPPASWDTPRIFQVVNDHVALIRAYKENLIYLEGVSTKNRANGDKVSLDGLVLRYCGTKQYATAIGGTNTVHWLQWVMDVPKN